MINLNPEDATLSLQVITIAEQLYGERPQLQKFHSQVSYVCTLTFDTLPPKVIKLERNEPGLIALEVQRLRALAALGLPVPSVEATSQDLPAGTTPFFVMPLVGTLRLGDLVWADRPSASAACRRAGTFLRHLHQHQASEIPATIIGTREASEFASLKRQLDTTGIAQLERVVQAVHVLEAETPHALCHGQFHTENVVVDDTGAFCVVDWDSLCVGSLWADVALFLATMQEWNNATLDHQRAFWQGLGVDEAYHKHEVSTWTLLETARGLDWRIAEGFVVEPNALSSFLDALAQFC